jgi:hypothetical protein
MAEPVTEPTQAPAAEPTQIEAVPDVSSSSSPELGDYSFEAALEASINAPEPEPQADAPAESAPEKVQPASPEPVSEATEGSEAVEDPTETMQDSDLLDSLDADVGDDWTPKASAAFQKLKTVNKTLLTDKEQLVQRAKEAEAKVLELEGAIGNETVDTLKTKVEEYEQAQMFSNLEATDAYQSAVIQPLEQVFSSVEALAEAHQIEYNSLVEAMMIEDPTAQEERVSELMAGASDRDRATFYRLATEVEPILQRRDVLMTNVEEALREANLVAEQKEKEVLAQKAAERTATTERVVQRISDKVPFLTEFEGLDLEAITVDASENDPTVVHPVDFAYQAVAARLMPAIVKEYVSSQKLIESLTKQLASYEDAEPKLSSGSAPSSLAGSPSAAGDFGSAIEKALGG